MGFIDLYPFSPLLVSFQTIPFAKNMDQSEAPKIERTTPRPFKMQFESPLRTHHDTPQRSSLTSLDSLEGGASGMIFASSSELSFGDEIANDAALEGAANATVSLPATGEPLALVPIPTVEEIPLPEEVRRQALVCQFGRQIYLHGLWRQTWPLSLLGQT
jgi:hypothetical protein